MQKLRKYYVILKPPKWVILNLLLFWPFHRNDKLGGAGVPWTAIVTSTTIAYGGWKETYKKTCCAKVALCEKLFFQCARLKLPSWMGAMFFCVYTHKDSTCFSPLWMDEAKFDHRILFRLLVWFYLGLQDVPGNSWIFAFPSLELQNSSRWCGCLRKNCWSFLRSRGYDGCSPGELALGMEGPILLP